MFIEAASLRHVGVACVSLLCLLWRSWTHRHRDLQQKVYSQMLPRTPQLCTVLILSLPLQDSQERKRGLLSRGWHTSRPEQLFWTGHLVSVAVTSSEKVGWVSVEPFPKGAVEMSVHVWLGCTSKMSGWRHRRSSGKPPRRKEFDALHPHPLSCVALCLYAHACVFTGTGIC